MPRSRRRGARGWQRSSEAAGAAARDDDDGRREHEERRAGGGKASAAARRGDAPPEAAAREERSDRRHARALAERMNARSAVVQAGGLGAVQCGVTAASNSHSSQTGAATAAFTGVMELRITSLHVSG